MRRILASLAALAALVALVPMAIGPVGAQSKEPIKVGLIQPLSANRHDQVAVRCNLHLPLRFIPHAHGHLLFPNFSVLVRLLNGLG